MKPIARNEILGIADYETIRPHFRARIVDEKKIRRVPLGDRVTVVFENRDTVLLQIQEMLRTERITREAAILHEIATYNALVPGDSELTCTLMIEIMEREEREAFLTSAVGFERHVAIEVDGERLPAAWEASRELEGRTSAVHYLRFKLPSRAAAALRPLADPKAAPAPSPPAVSILVDHPVHAVIATLADRASCFF